MAFNFAVMLNDRHTGSYARPTATDKVDKSSGQRMLWIEQIVVSDLTETQAIKTAIVASKGARSRDW